MEYEAGILTRKNAVLTHHNQKLSIQQRFVAHARALVKSFQEAGNSFDESSDEVSLSTPDMS